MSAMPPGAQWMPLPIYCGPAYLVDMDRLRAVKATMDLPFKVVPQDAHQGDLERRVLAWGTPPPFLCSYALVTPESSDEAIAEAIRYVTWQADSAQGMTDLEHLLGVWLGPGVREVSKDELEAEAKYAAYEAGTD